MRDTYEFYPAEAYAGTPGPSQGFRYLPAIAFLFVPFGWLPLEVSALAFFALKLAAVCGDVGATVTRHTGLSEGRRPVFLIALLIVAGYLVEELRFGNVHFLVVTLMVFAYDRAEAGAGPAACLCARGRHRHQAHAVRPARGTLCFGDDAALCLVTASILVFLILAPAAVLGGPLANAPELRAYARYAGEKINEGDNYALRGALVRHLTSGQSDVSHVEASVANLPMAVINGIWLIGLVGLGLAALVAIWREDDDPIVRLLEFSVVLTGIVLASPHTQRRYFVTLFVPALTLAALVVRRPAPTDRRSILIALLAIARAGHDSAACGRRTKNGAALRGQLSVFFRHTAPVRDARQVDAASKG